MDKPDMKEELQTRFTYHAPREGQQEKYQRLRDEGHALAKSVVELCPVSREASVALTKIEEAIMWANSAIARRDKGDERTTIHTEESTRVDRTREPRKPKLLKKRKTK